MHSFQNTCQARFHNEESIEIVFEALRLQLRALRRYPSLALELTLKVNMHNLQNSCQAGFTGEKIGLNNF